LSDRDRNGNASTADLLEARVGIELNACIQNTQVVLFSASKITMKPMKTLETAFNLQKICKIWMVRQARRSVNIWQN
jgi:hypothetical protein